MNKEKREEDWEIGPMKKLLERESTRLQNRGLNSTSRNRAFISKALLQSLRMTFACGNTYYFQLRNKA